MILAVLKAQYSRVSFTCPMRLSEAEVTELLVVASGWSHNTCLSRGHQEVACPVTGSVERMYRARLPHPLPLFISERKWLAHFAVFSNARQPVLRWKPLSFPPSF